MLRVAVPGLSAVLVAVAVACGGDGGGADRAAPTADADLTRSAEAGGVTVEATWLTTDALNGVDADLRSYPLEKFVLVEVQFTTHSGSLNEIDMVKASAMKQGDASGAAAAWVSLSDDSHHRAGVLVFKRPANSGAAELTLDLSGKEVALLWESPPG